MIKKFEYIKWMIRINARISSSFFEKWKEKEKNRKKTVKTMSPITYYWTVPLILDHSYLVEKSTSSKIADT
jgi:hypothetical protein